METATQQLTRAAEDVKTLAHSLLRDHSYVERFREQEDYEPKMVFLSPHGNNWWKELDTVGKQLESRVREEYIRLLAI